MVPGLDTKASSAEYLLYCTSSFWEDCLKEIAPLFKEISAAAKKEIKRENVKWFKTVDLVKLTTIESFYSLEIYLTTMFNRPSSMIYNNSSKNHQNMEKDIKYQTLHTMYKL